MTKTAPRRAYINPLPTYPEAAQRADILKTGAIDEWYVESQKVTRADFIKHLRRGDTAVVAHVACLAKASGRIDSRLHDLSDARGDIHAKGCVLMQGHMYSDTAWSQMKVDARQFMLAQRSIKNGSKRKYMLTDAQVKNAMRIKDSKKYTNDNQRLAALKKEGIVIGRTFMVTTLPQIARDRGLLD